MIVVDKQVRCEASGLAQQTFGQKTCHKMTLVKPTDITVTYFCSFEVFCLETQRPCSIYIRTLSPRQGMSVEIIFCPLCHKPRTQREKGDALFFLGLPKLFGVYSNHRAYILLWVLSDTKSQEVSRLLEEIRRQSRVPILSVPAIVITNIATACSFLAKRWPTEFVRRAVKTAQDDQGRGTEQSLSESLQTRRQISKIHENMRHPSSRTLVTDQQRSLCSGIC